MCHRTGLCMSRRIFFLSFHFFFFLFFFFCFRSLGEGRGMMEGECDMTGQRYYTIPCLRIPIADIRLINAVEGTGEGGWS